MRILSACLGVLLLVSAVYAQESAKATINVKLPADAVLLIEDYKSTQTGALRKLDTPPLPPGKEYTYTLKATWTEGGKEVSKTRTVKVTAGGTFEVDFTAKEVPPPPKPGTLELKPLTNLTLLPGEKKSLTVEIKRDNLKDAVKLVVKGLPAKVTVSGDTIPAEMDKATLEFTAAKDAAPGSSELTLTASAGTVVKEAKFKLTLDKTADTPLPELKVEAIPTLTVQAGGETPLELSLKTAHLDKPIEVTFTNLPTGVTIGALTLPIDKTAGKTTVKASETAAAGDSKVKVTAVSGATRTEVEFTLTVKAKPVTPKPAGLKVSAPEAVEIDSGASKPLAVKITRENFEGPVTVTFSGLPSGATLKELIIAKDKSEATATLEVAKDAKAGVSSIKLVASSGDTKAETTLKLTVSAPTKPPPPKPAGLKVEAPAKLDIEAGQSKEITLKISRENFEGPVTLAFTGQPETLKLPALTIPADKSDTALTVALPKEMAGGDLPLLITATAGDTKATTTLTLVVKVAPKPMPPTPMPTGTLKASTLETLTLPLAGPAKLLPIKVVRTGYDGPVTVSFTGVPEGVTLGEAVLAGGKGVVYVEATVGADAKEGESTVTVKATGGTTSTSTTFKVIVKK